MSTFVSNCMKALERKEMKEEMNSLFRPFIDLILIEIYPYVYISFIFIIISFLLILGIFIILIRNHYMLKPII
jgi:hypothetical protein